MSSEMFASHARISLLTLFALLFSVYISSCSKKDVKSDEPLINPSDTSGAPVDAPPPVDTAGSEEGGGSSELKTIYFEFDQYDLRSDAKSALKSNALWLKQNNSVAVQIEGNCDERGTTEYNLALGQRRADRVREYLLGLGIDRSRLTVVSYGEERPSDSGHDETAWGRNRRADFAIQSR